MTATDQSYRVLLEPSFLSKLQGLDMIARIIVEGFLTGLHKSPYHGFSVEFAEHRQYMPGDPIRHVDWKVYAKSDRFYIKEYEQETNLRAYILLDVSSSTPFCRRGADREDPLWDLPRRRAGLPDAPAAGRGGACSFSDQIHRIIPARSARTHLRVLFAEMESALRERPRPWNRRRRGTRPTSGRASSSSPIAPRGGGS